jgi:hypothetical protein
VRYLCLNLAGMDRLESGIEEGMSLHRGAARVHSVLQRCTAQGVSLMGPNKLFLQALETKRATLNFRRPKNQLLRLIRKIEITSICWTDVLTLHP